MGDECDKQINLGNFVFDEEKNRGSFLDVRVIDLFLFLCANFRHCFNASMSNYSNNVIHYT